MCKNLQHRLQMKSSHTFQSLYLLKYATKVTLTIIQNLLSQNFHNDEYPTTRRPATPNLANRQ